MKKLSTLLLVAFFLPSASYAAVARVSATNMTNSTTASVDTTSGANRVMCVGIGGATTDTVTGVTVGSDTLTFESKVQVSGNRYHYNYCGVLTVTGTQTVTITGSGLALSTAVLYSGAGVPKNPRTATGNSQAPSVSASPAPAADSWIFGGGGNDATFFVAGANTTCVSEGGVCSSSIEQADSNGIASPTALNWTLVVTGNWAAYLVEIPAAAAVASVPTSIQSLVQSLWW